MWDPESSDEGEPDQDAAPKVRVTRRIDYNEDGRGYLNDKRAQVFVVDVESGEQRMVTRDAVDHRVPRWSPDGKKFAVGMTFLNRSYSRLALVDVDSGDREFITPECGFVDLWSWSPDGTRILYTGDTVVTAQSDFFLYDVGTGTTTRLTKDLQVLPGAGPHGMTGPYMPNWLDDHQALFCALHGGRNGLYTITLADGTIEKLYDWDASLTSLGVDDSHRYVVQDYTSLEADGEISVYDAQANKAMVITDYSQLVLATHPPARWECFEVQRGSYSIEAWVLKPADFDPGRKYPAILDIHGGPQLCYGNIFYPLHQLLATNGFVLVFCNPRGSTSYGREFTEQVIEDWGGEDFSDLMAVMDTVCQLPYVDEQRTGVSGYSYGGYMTSWIIGQTDRFQACVCGAPVFDLESTYGTSDIGHSFGERHWGAAPHRSKEWYAARSPSAFAYRETTPTLIIQGEADERCPIGQSEQMFVTLKKANCEVEFARYPGASHLFILFGLPAHREDYLERILAWVKEHLGEPV